MYETAKDIQTRYEEISLGGLATLSIIEC